MQRGTVGEVYVDGFFPRAMLERSNTEFESLLPHCFISLDLLSDSVPLKHNVFGPISHAYATVFMPEFNLKGQPFGRLYELPSEADIINLIRIHGELRLANAYKQVFLLTPSYSL